MPSRMRRSVTLVCVLVAAAASSLGGQTARPAFHLVHTDHAVPVVGVNL